MGLSKVADKEKKWKHLRKENVARQREAKKEANKLHRHESRRKKRDEERANKQVEFDNLVHSIIDLVDVDDATMESLRNSFEQDPRLALVYFWLCGPHPDAFIYNDERADDPAVIERVMKAIGNPVGQEEAVRCQASVAECDLGSSRMAACASCNEVLYSNVHEIVDAGPVELLSHIFRLTDKQVTELLSKPADLVERHVSALKHNRLPKYSIL